jgi:hypothetical protein
MEDPFPRSPYHLFAFFHRNKLGRNPICRSCGWRVGVVLLVFTLYSYKRVWQFARPTAYRFLVFNIVESAERISGCAHFNSESRSCHLGSIFERLQYLGLPFQGRNVFSQPASDLTVLEVERHNHCNSDHCKAFNDVTDIYAESRIW